MRRRIILLLAVGVLVAPVIAACGRPPGHISAPPSTPGPSATGPSASTMPSTPPIGAGTWRKMAAAPVFAGYYEGVWTGTELFIHTPFHADMGNPKGTIDAAYNPVTDTWRQLPSSPYDVMLVEGGERLVWTGTEILILGLTNAAYNPSTNTWRPLPSGMFGPSVTVWTGRQVLMWGGGCCSSSTNSGSAFDLVSNAWQPMPASPLSPRHAAGVWTGTELIVIGGTDYAATFADGAAYNPTNRTWRSIPSLPQPVQDASVTWTGTEVFVVGGARPSDSWPAGTATAMAYNPATNSWRSLADMPFARYHHTAVWTGHQLLVWGGEQAPTTGGPPTTPPNGVAYDPVTNSWSPMPAAPLLGRTSMISAWTGDELLVWGGLGVAEPGALADGACFEPDGS